ncbi:murein hydrolase activator EnvC family protein [Marinobacterium jannaschii]|uniref:murein hydrolase activator EnvC family protein n=1 Tax=Marinobacterium jannaschii TaxID=64970 RepID=UPI00047FDB82|nr:peptidoglycan DD-metalloendopeptidase family protein [Marinobacterium jannaschii]
MRKLFTPLVLLLALLLALPAVAAKDATESQLKKLRQNISALQRDLKKQQSKASELSRALQSSEREIATLSRSIRSLERKLKKLRSNAGGLEKKRDSLRRDLVRLRQVIRLQIRDQYRQGNLPRLQLILSQKDPEEVSRMLRYHDKISRSLLTRIEQFRNTLADLGSTETDLNSVELDIAAKLKRQKAEAVRLEAEQGKRRNLLAKVQAEIKTDKRQLARYRADQQRLGKVLKEIKRSLDAAQLVHNDKAFRTLKGKLPWPLKGSVRRTFGSNRDNIRYDGIFISGRDGHAVKAIHHGRVVFADFLRGYGLVIIIDHGDNYLSLYGHNQSINRDVGDWVSAGDVVAAVGRSGGQSESGLYFAIRRNGKADNPQRWLGRRG